MRSGGPDDVEDRAAAWAVRIADRELTATEQQQLDDWLAADSRHLGAYIRAQAVWLDMDRVSALDVIAKSRPVHYRRPPPWREMAIAASLLLSLGGSYVAYDRLDGRTVSEAGQVRNLALEDGSKLYLNSDTVTQVRFAANARRVTVRHGEAMFDVRHDSKRPFIVQAGDVAIRAVGTRFAVKVDPVEGVSVTVAEGRVALSGDGVERLAGGNSLGRNEQFFASRGGMRRASLDGAEVNRGLAWHSGLLVFNGQRLAAAVAQVNRYAKLPIEINDSKLGRAEFVGTFKVGDSMSFARAAALAFDADVRRVGDRLVLMRIQDSPLR